MRDDGHLRARPRIAGAAEGDLVAIRSAGAYGAVLSSTYNARPLVPEVLVKGDRYDMVRRRQSFEEMIELESVPGWLDESGAVPGPKRRAG